MAKFLRGIFKKFIRGLGKKNPTQKVDVSWVKPKEPQAKSELYYEYYPTKSRDRAETVHIIDPTPDQFLEYFDRLDVQRDETLYYCDYTKRHEFIIDSADRERVKVLFDGASALNQAERFELWEKGFLSSQLLDFNLKDSDEEIKWADFQVGQLPIYRTVPKSIVRSIFEHYLRMGRFPKSSRNYWDEEDLTDELFDPNA
jgi:hypothetical protein